MKIKTDGLANDLSVKRGRKEHSLEVQKLTFRKGGLLRVCPFTSHARHRGVVKEKESETTTTTKLV